MGRSGAKKHMKERDYDVLIGDTNACRKLRLREFMNHQDVRVMRYKCSITKNNVVLVRMKINDKWWHNISMADPFDWLDMGEVDKENMAFDTVEKIYNIHKFLTVGEL